MSPKRQRLLAIAVAAGTFVIVSSQVALRGKLAGPTNPYNEQFRMARYLHNGTGFVCPVGPERNDPSSWYAPGYIALVAVVMSIFGQDSEATMAVVRLGGIAAMSVSFACYFFLALRRFGAKVAGIALVLMLLSPSLMFKASEVWDTLWAMLGGSLLLTLFVLYPPKRRIAVFASGLACGGVAMINPSFTLCYPVWVLHAWWVNRPEKGRIASFLQHVALVLAGVVLSIAPWTVRNYSLFGELFYLRGNLPMELWSGNAPWSDGYGDIRDPEKPHPVFDRGEGQRMVELGEYAYFQSCREDVRKWWREDKGRFARLTLARIRWFWFGRYYPDAPWKTDIIKKIAVAGPTVLGIIGAIVVLWKRRDGLVILMTVLIFPMMYYVTQIMVRYRLPIEPVLLLLGAIGIAGLWGGRKGGGGSGRNSARPIERRPPHGSANRAERTSICTRPPSTRPSTLSSCLPDGSAPCN